MNGERDAFGNDRYHVRVPHKASISGFEPQDIANLKSAAAEMHGFAGKEIAACLELVGCSQEALSKVVGRLTGPSSLQEASNTELCHLFVLSSLVAAALGDEELATITASGRDEHFLTARRLYHALGKKLGKSR